MDKVDKRKKHAKDTFHVAIAATVDARVQLVGMQAGRRNGANTSQVVPTLCSGAYALQVVARRQLLTVLRD